MIIRRVPEGKHKTRGQWGEDHLRLLAAKQALALVEDVGGASASPLKGLIIELERRQQRNQDYSRVHGTNAHLRDDFDVFFAMKDVINQFVENYFLRRTNNNRERRWNTRTSAVEEAGPDP